MGTPMRASLPAVGSRIRLRHQVERYPHFWVPAGAEGEVVDVGDPNIYAVRVTERVEGAEDWDNEIHWSLDAGDDPSPYLEIVVATEHDCGDPIWESERNKYRVECSCGWETREWAEESARQARSQHLAVAGASSAEFVNREALRDASVPELYRITQEGGPEALVVAAREQCALSLDTMGEEELRALVKDLLPRALDEVEALTLLDTLGDSELYVDDGQGGWVAEEAYESVLAPMIRRLRSVFPAVRQVKPREVLVHLNIEVPEGDERSPDEIVDVILRLVNGGQGHDGTARPIGGALRDFTVTAPLAEEV